MTEALARREIQEMVGKAYCFESGDCETVKSFQINAEKDLVIIVTDVKDRYHYLTKLRPELIKYTPYTEPPEEIEANDDWRIETNQNNPNNMQAAKAKELLSEMVGVKFIYNEEELTINSYEIDDSFRNLIFIHTDKGTNKHNLECLGAELKQYVPLIEKSELNKSKQEPSDAIDLKTEPETAPIVVTGEKDIKPLTKETTNQRAPKSSPSTRPKKRTVLSTEEEAILEKMIDNAYLIDSETEPETVEKYAVRVASQKFYIYTNRRKYSYEIKDFEAVIKKYSPFAGRPKKILPSPTRNNPMKAKAIPEPVANAKLAKQKKLPSRTLKSNPPRTTLKLKFFGIEPDKIYTLSINHKNRFLLSKQLAALLKLKIGNHIVIAQNQSIATEWFIGKDSNSRFKVSLSAHNLVFYNAELKKSIYKSMQIPDKKTVFLDVEKTPLTYNGITLYKMAEKK